MPSGNCPEFRAFLKRNLHTVIRWCAIKPCNKKPCEKVAEVKSEEDLRDPARLAAFGAAVQLPVVFKAIGILERGQVPLLGLQVRATAVHETSPRQRSVASSSGCGKFYGARSLLYRRISGSVQ